MRYREDNGSAVAMVGSPDLVWSGSFQELVRRHRLQSVALDLRDTLVCPPREDKVFRALMAAGVPAPIARMADEAARTAICGRLSGVQQVVDWKLVELYEGVAALARHGYLVDGPAFEMAFRSVCAEYLSCTVALVSDDQLAVACRALADEGCSVAVVTDGVHEREYELLRRLLPRSSEVLYLATSSLLRANKFEPEFYRRFADRLGVELSRVLVVGNRIDKDVLPARAAGCLTCLLNDARPAGYSGYWARDAAALLDEFSAAERLPV